MSASDAAKKLGISVRTLYRWRTEGLTESQIKQKLLEDLTNEDAPPPGAIIN